MSALPIFLVATALPWAVFAVRRLVSKLPRWFHFVSSTPPSLPSLPPVSVDSAALPEGLLLALLQSDDLCVALLCAMPPAVAVRVGFTCKSALDRLTDRRVAAQCARFMGRRPATTPGEPIDGNTRLCDVPPHERLGFTRAEPPGRHEAGGEGGAHLMPHGRVWTFERLHLRHLAPVFREVSFRFASDRLCKESVDHRLIPCLRRHPGLRLRVLGYARQETSPELGRALAHARAVRVRQALVRAMQSVGRWLDEDPDLGVHPSGFEAGGRDLEKRIEFYQGNVTLVGGAHIQAIGMWPASFSDWTRFGRIRALKDAHTHGREAACDIAEVVIVGFEPMSALAM
ncbi:hypothetical protein AB1Y20_002481 [Prymnesium parvum]|uniref:F-box domain-containing protein n=1 Tax=Prymnesium parvum TaxID=97485 RepID=A0AB34JB74_PRYPA